MPLQPSSNPPTLRLSAGAGDPVIEALRGVAALMVMATHFVPLLRPQSGLWGFASTGVDLFFVLSGYVFAPYLLGKPLKLLPHLIRRFFRLYPLYVCALLLFVGLRWPDASAWTHFVAHLFMAHTLSSLEVAAFYNPAFWSLPPEVEYYLLLPLLAWAATRWRFAGLLLLAAALHLLLVALATPGEGVSARAIATVHAPGLLVEFMLGSWAYVLLLRDAQGHHKWLRLSLGLCIVLGMLALYAQFLVAGSATAPLWISGNFGVGAALGYALLVSALAWPERTSVGRYTPWLRHIGELSYGVYLFHNAAPQLLARWWPSASGVTALLLCVALTLLLATLMHYAVEQPLRSYGRRLSQTLTK